MQNDELQALGKLALEATKNMVEAFQSLASTIRGNQDILNKMWSYVTNGLELPTKESTIDYLIRMERKERARERYHRRYERRKRKDSQR